MLTKSRIRTLYLAALLGLLVVVTLGSACFGGDEPNSTESYCQQHPGNC